MAEANLTFKDKICIEMQADAVRLMLGEDILFKLVEIATPFRPSEDGPVRITLIHTAVVSSAALKAGPILDGRDRFRLASEDIIWTEWLSMTAERALRFTYAGASVAAGRLYLAYDPSLDVPDEIFVRALYVTD